MAKIVTTEGEHYYAYPEMAGRFQPGTAWRIETTDNEWQGRTYRRIVKCAAIKQAAPKQAASGGLDDIIPPSAGAPAAPAKPPAGPTDETYFVVEMLKTLIAHGHLTPPDIGQATRMLREAYRGDK